MEALSPLKAFPAGEIRRVEKPCADLDIDCLALDGVVPFGDYDRCYLYFPERGRCPFRSRRARPGVGPSP